MRLLVATEETQGSRLNDFCFCDRWARLRSDFDARNPDRGERPGEVRQEPARTGGSYEACRTQSMMAARSAECRVMPWALARVSSRSQTGAGNLMDRGSVGPVSVPFLGLPGRTWTMPSAATRAA